MSCTVFAERMGLFHKGSGGKGVAPGDVCLSPPPPPTGPVPVPYVNVLQASNLAKGSKKVKIDGQPTALENASEISTSSGDEAGTQGGNVVTHKTKGKGTFMSWSFTVQVEGKGVACHGDQIGQNGASGPPGVIDASAITTLSPALTKDAGKPCPPGSETPKTSTNQKQRDKVNKSGSVCWGCGATSNSGTYKSGRKYKKRFIADHQPPQSYVWKFLGGCHNKDEFEKWKKSEDAVQPHCHTCSTGQSQAVKEPTSALEAITGAWPG